MNKLFLMVCLFSTSLFAAYPLVNVDFDSDAHNPGFYGSFSGVGILGSSGDTQWNIIKDQNLNGLASVDSEGNPLGTPLTLNFSHAGAPYGVTWSCSNITTMPSNFGDLMGDYVYIYQGASMNAYITGLIPDTIYQLVIYTGVHDAYITVDGDKRYLGFNYLEDRSGDVMTENIDYLFYEAVKSDATGLLTILFEHGPLINLVSMGGFQIQQISILPLSPAKGETGVDRFETLAWEDFDSGNTTGYDVYFKTGDPNTGDPNFMEADKIASKQIETAIDPTPGVEAFEFETTYYWRVDVWRDTGSGEVVTEGSVWNFTTQSIIPTVTFITPPQAVTLGESASFTVISEHTEDGQWYKVDQAGDIALSDGAKYTGTDTATLTIINVAVEDEGEYYCEVYNSYTSEVGISDKTILYNEMFSGPPPIHHWPFDGDLLDVASGNNGTANGTVSYATGVDGASNAAIYLASVSDYVSSQSGITIDGSELRTLSFWFKSAKIMEAAVSYGDRVGFYNLFEVLLDYPDGGFAGHFWGSNDTVTVGGGANPSVSWNTWTMATITYDGTTVTLYQNGALKRTSTIALGTAPTPMYIGGGNVNGGAFYDGFVGYIDDVRLYDYVFDADAVADLYYDMLTENDPPTPNPAMFSSFPSADSSSAISMTATTGTDVTGPVEYFFNETSGNNGGTDSGWQSSPSYTDDGLDVSTEYTYTVQMRDSDLGIPNVGTASDPASATTGADITAPTPNKATWASPPSPDSSSAISMTATTGTDQTGPVEYFFDETSGNSGGTDSVWQSSPSYTDSGLDASTQYTYMVQMRDSVSPAPNVGTASSPANATTYAESDPPTPNPATFSFGPSADSSSAISMTATTGTDASGPVEYFFDEISGNNGATDSGWQTSPNYTDSGLDANTQYTYTVQMRDSVGVPNVGAVSSPAYATTHTDTTAPTPSTATWFSAPSPDSRSAISMTATPGTDQTGPVEYFFDETSGNSGGTDSGWQTSPSYTDIGLYAGTQYTYTVQMRDSVSPTPNVGTASSPANATTDSGLVYHWPFDGDLLDVVGGNNGTVNGTVIYVPGANGALSSAIYLASASDYVSSTADLSIAGSSDRTISFWFKSAQQTQAAVSYGGRSANGTLFEVLINYPTGGYAGHFWGLNMDTGASGSGSQPSVSWNTWTMATMTYNGATVKLYQNGVLKRTAALALDTTSTPMYIGGHNDSAWYGNYAGYIDDVRLYDYAFDSTEVTALYNAM